MLSPSQSWHAGLTCLTHTGFVLQAQAPNSSLLPSGVLYPTQQLSWTCSGLPVPGLFGTLLPSVLGFAGPLPPGQKAAQSTMQLADMQVVYQACDTSWSEAAQVVAQPSGVRDQAREATLSSAMHAQLSGHGCRPASSSRRALPASLHATAPLAAC